MSPVSIIILIVYLIGAIGTFIWGARSGDSDEETFGCSLLLYSLFWIVFVPMYLFYIWDPFGKLGHWIAKL